jgi:hypothetical protein
VITSRNFFVEFSLIAIRSTFLETVTVKTTLNLCTPLESEPGCLAAGGGELVTAISLDMSGDRSRGTSPEAVGRTAERLECVTYRVRGMLRFF